MKRGDAIVLIGFMGAGKSSAGRALAARTSLPLYDTDRMVAARFGLGIPEIFARHGEEAFRAAESEALAQVPAQAAIVVTGGGMALRADNVIMMRQLGTTVHLVADEATLFERLSRRTTRPLLQTENPRATIAELLRVREPLYREMADVTVDTSALTHDAVVETILARIQKIHSHVG